MSELRWHPFLQQWVVYATHRQGRPQMPKDWCPFCPGSGRVPDQYDVFLYPNDFPSFSFDADPFLDEHFLGARTGARGACDVVLYSPDHTRLPSDLGVANWRQVVELWTQRYQDLAAQPDVAYISIFENTGEAIGVTMPHPHGQIYAFPFLPPIPAKELEAVRADTHLFQEVLDLELKEASRLVYENASWVAFLPHFGRFPTEMFLYPRRHVGSLPEMTEQERQEFAEALHAVRRKYDVVYGSPMALMMLLKSRPVRPAEEAYRFHVQFLPLRRSETKLKYLASVESGLNTFLVDVSPEEMAERLRAIAV